MRARRPPSAAFLAAAAVLVIAAGPGAAFAQTGVTLPATALGSAAIYEHSLKALTMLLVVAVLIENALSVIFNWRVFLTYFSLRGVKTVVSFALSYAIVLSFGLDVFGDLLTVYLAPPDKPLTDAPDLSSPISGIVTALILAGGSGGVHNLMVALGYRQSTRADEVNPTAPATKAWLAIWLDRAHAVGPVRVDITEVASPTADPGATAGVIGARRPSIRELLLRNPNRFPQNGGYEVDPGKVYRIEVVGQDASGTAVQTSFSGKEFRFAPGAVVDLETRL